MKKIIVILLCVFFSTSFAQDIQRHINVSGNAEITVTADYIHFVIQIRNINESLKKSRETNVNASDELISILKEFKIKEDDWELSPIEFGKEYSYTREERKLIGYFSVVNVNVKLRVLEKYYEFISRLSENTLFEITQSEYGLSDYKKYHKEAIIKSAKAAKEKAMYLAESMGIKTGKVLQITEMSNFDPSPARMNNALLTKGGSAGNISGDIKISRSVNMQVEILD